MNKSTRTKYSVLVNTYGKKSLMETAKTYGVSWEEDYTNEGKNWLRFSMALCRFIESGGEFELGEYTEEEVNALVENFTSIKNIIKRSMNPYVKSCMEKLQEPTGGANLTTDPNALISNAMTSLNERGGIGWSRKVNLLNQVNYQLKILEDRQKLYQGSAESQQKPGKPQ